MSCLQLLKKIDLSLKEGTGSAVESFGGLVILFQRYKVAISSFE